MTNADVIVIGAGLVGCATAYYLSKEGARVKVIDRGQINRGASGQNAGSLHFQIEHRHLEHIEQSQKDVGEFMYYLLQAKAFWENLEEELNTDLELVQHGGLMVAETKEEMDLLQKKSHLENKWGLQTGLLTQEDVRNMAPYISDRVIGALHSSDEGHANPRIVTLAFAKRAQELGAEFLTETNVIDLNQFNDKWNVAIENGEELVAPNVVLAVGPWMKELAEMVGLYVPTYPIPLIMNVTEPVAPTIHHLIQHVGKRLTLKQVDDGNVIIGGGWSGKFLKSKGKLYYKQTPSILTDHLIGNVKVAAEVVPAVKNFRLIRSWSGVAGFNSDQLSLLGEFPERKGLYTGGGDGSFTYGPLHGKILSDLIVHGKTSYSIDAYDPSKFSHLNMFMP